MFYLLILIIKQLDSENKHICLRPIPHTLRNWQVLYYVLEIDYDHEAAILSELKSKC